MRLVNLESIKTNIALKKPIYNESGQILLGEGVPLTERLIERLKARGITTVYVDDPESAGIEVKEVLKQETRTKAMQTIKSTLETVHNGKDLSRIFVQQGLDKTFSSLVQDILKDIQNNGDALSLLTDVYAHDNYIFAHSLNVTIYSLALASRLNLTPRQLKEIGLGAMLHDVGKMQIDLEVLSKPGRLDDHEFEEMKKHSEYGFEILRRISTVPLVAAHCAYQHHERIDGSGYPRGLKGDEIHLYSRIIGIADVFDAVTTNRVYRKAMLPHEGLEILYAGAGTQFEYEFVEAFRKAIVVYPAGLKVNLNDGRKGIVVRPNIGLSERPVIRIVEENNVKVVAPYEVDLAKDLTSVIVGADMIL
ncbi:HD-GYP domain-containing protein [Bacillus tianshenii]|nr:HD-GYP domain-containing protein [Bacillus tianshenii]